MRRIFIFIIITFCITISSGQSIDLNYINGYRGTSLAQREELKILSWNIYMLPAMSNFIGYGVFSGKKKRAKAIVEELKKLDYDIVVFQEAFHKGARKKLKRGLVEIYPYMYGPANRRKIAIKTNSGIWIFSKIPLKELKVIDFKQCQGIDCWARKGALLVEGLWNGNPFQLIGTHLESGPEQYIRKSQYEEIYQYLIEPYQKTGVPQFICGDLNTNSADSMSYMDMLNTLKAENGELLGEVKVTIGGIANDMSSGGTTNQYEIDYILVRDNGTGIKSIKRKVSILQHQWSKKRKDLSDHYGVEATIEF